MTLFGFRGSETGTLPEPVLCEKTAETYVGLAQNMAKTDPFLDPPEAETRYVLPLRARAYIKSFLPLHETRYGEASRGTTRLAKSVLPGPVSWGIRLETPSEGVRNTRNRVCTTTYARAYIKSVLRLHESMHGEASRGMTRLAILRLPVENGGFRCFHGVSGLSPEVPVKQPSFTVYPPKRVKKVSFSGTLCTHERCLCSSTHQQHSFAVFNSL